MLFIYRSLEYVGTLNRRMRVIANDDVYEATRHRMVAVDKLHKKSWYDSYLLFVIYLLLYICTQIILVKLFT